LKEGGPYEIVMTQRKLKIVCFKCPIIATLHIMIQNCGFLLLLQIQLMSRCVFVGFEVLTMMVMKHFVFSYKTLCIGKNLKVVPVLN
jgi:hypothetical protein